MKLALHCHGELEHTMEENGRDEDPRKRDGELPYTQTCSKRSKSGVFVLHPPKDGTLVAWRASDASSSKLDDAQRPGGGTQARLRGEWCSVPLVGAPSETARRMMLNAPRGGA
ncbi:hypothetical protein LR48_Vigan07g101900 [Vigna angularis]|uniref:Uncharacterized protein n=1 Tax=Phaseolus angularis TaxID=3914 RepID=A0A0L9UWS4_PHAAN|nr:hypothetical protein LR48_Vigan07g101900 [Vigna angularis]